MPFFDLVTSHEMLAKAKRDYAVLLAHLCTDSILNFYVTANHIQDYVRRTSTIPADAVASFLTDQDLRDCRDLCDKGKHLTLTKRPDRAPRNGVGSSAARLLGPSSSTHLK